MIGKGFFLLSFLGLVLTESIAAKIDLPRPLLQSQGDVAAHVFLEGKPCRFVYSGQDFRHLTWKLEDVWGNEWRKEGPLPPSGEINLDDLSPGYYRLRVKETDEGGLPLRSETVSFARVRDLRQSKWKENPYSLDTAQSWLARPGFKSNPWQPSNAGEILSDLSAIAGLDEVRDRMTWSEIVRNPGQWNWSVYGRNIAWLDDRHIRTLEVFHDAPQVTRAGFRSIPRDLRALFNFGRESAFHFQGQVTDWEFWNEPDATFCSDSAWDFAAAQKAAYAGFKRGNPAARVLNGSAAIHPTNRFMELAMENGMGQAFDIFNFHVYKNAEAIDAVVAEKSALLEKFGAGGDPIWLTEVGLQNEGNGALPSLIPGREMREHDEIQELKQAQFLVKALIHAQFAGVEKSFFFVLPPYNESGGQKVWGLLRWDWTVKPGYAAFCNLVGQLVDQRCAGKIELPDGITGYRFEPRSWWKRWNQGPTFVLWSDHPSELVCSVDKEPLEVTDLFGRTVNMKADSSGQVKLAVTSSPQYIRGLDLDAWKTTTSSTRSPWLRFRPNRWNRDLVMAIRFDHDVRIMNRVSVQLPEDGPGHAELDIYNFSDHPQTLDIVNHSQGVHVDGLTSHIEIFPGQDRTVPFSVALDEDVPGSVYLHFSGWTGGKEVAPVHVPVRLSLAGLSRLEQKQIDVGEKIRWRLNSSGSSQITDSPNANEVHFLVRFPPGVDRWTYPYLTLDPATGLAGSIGLSYEIKAEAVEGKPTAVTHSQLFVNTRSEGQKRDFIFSCDRPGPEWKKEVYLWKSDAPSDFDPATAVSFQIGINSGGLQAAYSIRNLTIYYPGKKND